MCEDALARDPPSFCSAAHVPVFTDIDAADGVCPDRNKHPLAPGQMYNEAWSARLGITQTSGEGNEWYRQQRQGQT